MISLAKWIAGAAILFLPGLAAAGSIIPWSGSAPGRTLNDPAFLATRTMLVDQGLVVGVNGEISQGVLDLACLFIINEPGQAPSNPELVLFRSWIQQGGIFLLTADSGGAGVAAGNLILNAIGTGLSLSATSPIPVPAIAAGTFSTGLVGNSFSTSPSASVFGGTEIAGNYARYQQLGLGYVVVVGDAWYHPTLGGGNPNTINSQFLINLCQTAGCWEGGNEVPEGRTAAMVVAGLAGLAIFGGKKRLL